MKTLYSKKQSSKRKKKRLSKLASQMHENSYGKKKQVLDKKVNIARMRVALYLL